MTEKFMGCKIMRIYMDNKMKLKLGFTLIEVLVVVAIIGLLMALVAPLLTGGTNNEVYQPTEYNIQTEVEEEYIYILRSDSPITFEQQ